MYKSIQVMIVDDQEIIRKGFHVLVRKKSEIEIIGEAENGRELLDKLKVQHPDIVIMDIQMPVMDGIEATKELKKHYPHIGVLALTMFNEDNLIIEMLEAGARGYLLKNTNQDELAEAIKAVFNGGTYFCPSTSERLKILIGQSKFNPFRKSPKPSFTTKEVEIIQYICQELQNKDIAEKMNLSIRTIESYRERIFEKTNARTVAGITIYAIKQGFYKL